MGRLYRIAALAVLITVLSISAVMYAQQRGPNTGTNVAANITNDVLRRAGAEVTVASVMPQERITASRGVSIHADCLLDDCAEKQWGLIALPGGMPGAEHFHNCELLIKMLREQLDVGAWLGAICASPAVVLGRHGLLRDYRATCHSAFSGELRGRAKEVIDEAVVRDRAEGGREGDADAGKGAGKWGCGHCCLMVKSGAQLKSNRKNTGDT